MTGRKHLSALQLTARQKEVAEMVLKGMPNKDIAANIFRGVQTVKMHLILIFKKAGVASRSQFIANYTSNPFEILPDGINA